MANYGFFFGSFMLGSFSGLHGITLVLPVTLFTCYEIYIDSHQQQLYLAVKYILLLHPNPTL